MGLLYRTARESRARPTITNSRRVSKGWVQHQVVHWASLLGTVQWQKSRDVLETYPLMGRARVLCSGSAIDGSSKQGTDRITLTTDTTLATRIRIPEIEQHLYET